MTINKLSSTTSLQIEVESGQDSSGNATYKKRTFSNVRSDAALENIFDVATAIKNVMDVNTRNVLLSETSKLVSEE